MKYNGRFVTYGKFTNACLVPTYLQYERWYVFVYASSSVNAAHNRTTSVDHVAVCYWQKLRWGFLGDLRLPALPT